MEDTGKSMVLRKVVAEKKKELILFGSNVRKPGFIGELKSVLSELYQYNIGPEDFKRLQEISHKKPVLQAKLKDLLTIYEGFREFMRERYITAEELLVVLNDAIDYSEWVKGTVICLDGFTGFTPCQYQILRKLLRYAKKVMVTVTIDPEEDIKAPAKEFHRGIDRVVPVLSRLTGNGWAPLFLRWHRAPPVHDRRYDYLILIRSE